VKAVFGRDCVSQESKLTQLIRQQISIEGEHVKHLTELRKKVGIAAARLLLLEMRLDSEKHAAILTEMLEILKGVPPDTSLWEHELEEYVDETLVKREFEEHVKKESYGLVNLKQELKHTKDEGLKLLLQNIDDDEKKHHRIIETMVNNLYKID
jgi:rubrerythrin